MVYHGNYQRAKKIQYTLSALILRWGLKIDSKLEFPPPEQQRGILQNNNDLLCQLRQKLDDAATPAEYAGKFDRLVKDYFFDGMMFSSTRKHDNQMKFKKYSLKNRIVGFSEKRVDKDGLQRIFKKPVMCVFDEANFYDLIARLIADSQVGVLAQTSFLTKNKFHDEVKTRALQHYANRANHEPKESFVPPKFYLKYYWEPENGDGLHKSLLVTREFIHPLEDLLINWLQGIDFGDKSTHHPGYPVFINGVWQRGAPEKAELEVLKLLNYLNAQGLQNLEWDLQF